MRQWAAGDKSSLSNSALTRRDDDADEKGVRAQLKRVLESSDFDVTAAGRKLLTYVVEESLAGRADRIKAYSVATEALGRDASFDAHSDPIVRVEAGHLRRALQHYYLTTGKADPVVITVPKGGYVPVFEARRPAEAIAPAAQVSSGRRAPIATTALGLFAVLLLTAVGWLWLGSKRTESARPPHPDIPRLLVKPFEDLTKAGNSPLIAQGLTEEIISEIVRFKDIVTVEAHPDADPPSFSGEKPRFALAGSVSVSDDRIRLQARVLSLAGGTVLWTNSYDGDLKVSKLIAIEQEFARQIAVALGQPYGVIFQSESSQVHLAPPDDWLAYSCTLSYYAYRANLDPNIYQNVRNCLEAAVSHYPNYSTAWGMLSQTYVDEIRFGYRGSLGSPPASIDRALAAARRAVELDPDNVRGLQAEMLALYFHGDIAGALKVGEHAFGINPNDTDFVGDYGLRLALSGDWSRGCALIAQAREQNPGPLHYYEADLALCSYFRGEYREAVARIRGAVLPENPAYHLIAAVIYGESGEVADATRELGWLTANRPQLLKKIREDIAMRLARPEDVERVLESLRKAGLSIEPRQ